MVDKRYFYHVGFEFLIENPRILQLRFFHFLAFFIGWISQNAYTLHTPVF